ncbi:MAG: AMP-binding protein [Hyphomicrobiaceae bacterium]
MYPGTHATTHPDKAAFIMASTGEAVSYAELERRTNRLAHLLRRHGMRRLDHYAIFMENNARYVETCAAGARTGLYYTCVNSHLSAEELAYILDNSLSRILITSQAKRAVALEALALCPAIELCLVVDGPGDGARILDLGEATRDFPDTPVADEAFGAAMLYSSGTTGQPKGVLKPVADVPPGTELPVHKFRAELWRYREGMVYLSPAPLYHAAPQAAVDLTIRKGGTVVIMERFDAAAFLDLVQRHAVTHSQLVPTMFARMLKLPDAVRLAYDVSSLEVAIHAAAPCPVPLKEAMIAWWGPIIQEYYGATEGLGFSSCDSHEWLAHKGTVGRVLQGKLHVLDEAMQPCPVGVPGTLWFEPPAPFEYFRDPEKTAQSRSPDGRQTTVGDIGYLDEDGYLYLTDRATFMIISGGVNIYPQEAENLLITHPKVADAAVFGVPNADLGEEVKAVVQLMPGETPDPGLAQELIDFCRAHLAHLKCPRSIDFEAELPRLPTGKLYKRVLRDRYWQGHTSRIV